MVNVAVIYYSATGNVHRLAEAVALGAEQFGAHVRLRRVSETSSSDVIASNARWADHAAWASGPNGVEIAQLDDLDWADGIAFGSPTRFGGPASQLKGFIDASGGLWAADRLHNKVVTAFTSASTDHGGLESTILSILNVAYHWGSIIMPTGYASAAARTLGNPYGASWVSHRSAAPDENSHAAAVAQGKRLASISARLAPNCIH